MAVSDLEKTVIDCVDRHDLCGGIGEVARSISEALQRLDSKKILSYLERFRKDAPIQRLGVVLERLASEGFLVDYKLVQEMKSREFSYTNRLDFTQPDKGKLSKEWKIIENTDCMSWRN